MTVLLERFQVLLILLFTGHVVGFQAPRQRPCPSSWLAPLRSLYSPADESSSSSSSSTGTSSLTNGEQITIPIVIMDSILPRQTLHFSSPDPRFDALIRHVLSSHHSNEIGIIGWDGPTTKLPLNVGVTAPIVKKDIVFGINRDSERVLATTFQGTRRFRILGEPWMDPTDSFYIANVQILDHQVEPPLSLEQQQQVQWLHRNIPALVSEWVELLIQTEKLSPAGVTAILKETGPMPSEPRDRAMWIAALLNPTIPLGLCQEIRPAMLLCQTDADRMVLSTVALRTSIDQLGKGNR